VEGADLHGDGAGGIDSELHRLYFLVSRVNEIVLDMEKASTSIINLITEKPNGQERMKFQRNAEDLSRPARCGAFVGCCFC